MAGDDASFRRYFRIRRGEAQPSLVAMDAPPDREDCRSFVQVAHLFAEAGVHVPEIRAQDLERGFLLLSDLGSTTYLDALDGRNAGRLYGDALDALLRIQLASRPGVLPDYDKQLLERELRLFPDWYVARQLKRELGAAQRETLEQSFSTLLANNLGKARKAGLPVAGDFADFYRDFEWMGAQRQLKVLGIFARLFYRDGKDGYLKDQPLVMRYLRRTCGRYRELAALAHLLDELDAKEKRFGYTL